MTNPSPTFLARKTSLLKLIPNLTKTKLLERRSPLFQRPFLEVTPFMASCPENCGPLSSALTVPADPVILIRHYFSRRHLLQLGILTLLTGRR